MKNLYAIVILLLSCFGLSAQNVVVTATAGTTGPSNYNTLQLAFSAINNGVHQGAISIAITADITETSTAFLSASGGSSNYSSITISPSGAAVRTISGNIGGALVQLNGADNVVFDGLAANGLVFENTSVLNSGVSTILLSSDASNNRFTNCKFLGATTATSLGNSSGNNNAATVIVGRATTTGNDNNTFSFCEFGNASTGVPAYAINSHCGSATVGNDNLLIEDSKFYNFFHISSPSAAIAVNRTATGLIIRRNSFYQTATRANTGGSNVEHAFITLLSDDATNNISGAIIRDNYFGGSNANTAGTKYTLTGSVALRGLNLNVSAASTTLVEGNTFSNISINSTATSNIQNLINLVNGACQITNGNTFGSTTELANVIVQLPANTTSTPQFNIVQLWSGSVSTGASSVTNNFFGGLEFNTGSFTSYARIPSYRLIHTRKASFAALTINNNTIGSASITNHIVCNASTTLYGVLLEGSSSSNIQVNGNTIQNVSNNNTDLAASVNVINVSSNTGATVASIANNFLRNITNRGNNTGIDNNAFFMSNVGISVLGAAAANVDFNQLVGFRSWGVGNVHAKISQVGITYSSTNTTVAGAVSNNTITDFLSTCNYNAYFQIAPANAGIVLNTAFGGLQVFGNRIYNFELQSQIGNTDVIGISQIANVTSPGTKIFKNYIYDLRNVTDNQSAARIAGISCTGGGNSAANAVLISNNVISINNGGGVNDIVITGIKDKSNFNDSHNNYYYNTVNLYGHTNSDSRSYAFFREMKGTPSTKSNTTIKNNIFNNSRTNSITNFAGNFGYGCNGNGTDNPLLGFSANNNAFFVKNAVSWIATVENTNYNFANWKSSTSNDLNSVKDTIVFVDHLNANLRLQANNCALDGAAQPLTEVTDDFDAVTRSATLPDIGAFEFVSSPPTAAVTSDVAICSGTPTSIQIQFTGIPNWSFTYTTNGSPTTVNHYSQNSLTLNVAPTANTNYTITNLKSGSCYVTSFAIPTASVTIKPTYTWFGVNTNWFDAVNWCPGVPSSTSDVTIPNGATYYPIISSGNALARNISIANAANVVVNNTGRFNLYGNITNNGVFDLVDGSLVAAGAAAQTLSGATFKDKTIKNVEIANTSAANPVVSLSSTLNDTLKITGNLSFGNVNSKTFQTNGNLTLISNAANTASVNDLTNAGRNSGNQILGNANVERFIATPRKWQFIAINTNGAVQTVQNSWMERQTPTISGVSNYGTWITDGQPNSGVGFDAVSFTPSMKWYNGTDYTGITNPTAFNIKSKPAYFVFVRGDRNALNTNYVANTTVLRTYGGLVQGTTTAVTVPAGTNAIVMGNPYASAVDLTRLSYSHSNPINIAVWDPKLVGLYGVGGFQYLTSTGTGNFTVMPGGGSFGAANSVVNTFESGQAFFIQGSATARNVSFVESAKTSNSNNVYRQSASAMPAVMVSLLIRENGNDELVDGTQLKLAETANDFTDADNFRKLKNVNENLSIKKGNELLAIQYKSIIEGKDTVQLNIGNVRLKQYVLKLDLRNVNSLGLKAFLIDNYFNSTTTLSVGQENNYAFQIINQQASYAANRFLIVFEQAPLPKFVHVKANRNNYKQNEVEWKVANQKFVERYEVERSFDGQHFEVIATKQKSMSSENAVRAYATLDEKISYSAAYYRIKMKLVNAEVKYSQVVKVDAISSEEYVKVFANPVVNNNLQLLFSNKAHGTYTIAVKSADGALVQISNAVIQTYKQVINVPIKNVLAAGVYFVTITEQSGLNCTEKIIVN
jgi:hypothetical protein